MAAAQVSDLDPERQARASLGTIPVSQFRQHFIVFSISSLLMLAARVYNGVEVSGLDLAWHQIIDLIGDKAGSTMAACLGLSAIAVEGANMVLAELMKRRWAQDAAEVEARSEARGQAKMHRLWTEWLERKDAAETKGEPFNEPPPQPPNGTGRDS